MEVASMPAESRDSKDRGQPIPVSKGFFVQCQSLKSWWLQWFMIHVRVPQLQQHAPPLAISV